VRSAGAVREDQIREQRQMIRSNQRAAISMEFSILDFELVIEVNVIQMQQGHYRGIGASSPDMLPQIRKMKFG
jgi:hypothetical protein